MDRSDCPNLTAMYLIFAHPVIWRQDGHDSQLPKNSIRTRVYRGGSLTAKEVREIKDQRSERFPRQNR
jgi:hypothetical protein